MMGASYEKKRVNRYNVINRFLIQFFAMPISSEALKQDLDRDGLAHVRMVRLEVNALKKASLTVC